MLSTPEQSIVEQHIVEDAAYFSRRAREELRAAVEAKSGKARRSHLQLAEAYECRSHLITNQLLRAAGC